MIDPGAAPAGGDPGGAPGRGLALVAAAFVLGILVLRSMGAGGGAGGAAVAATAPTTTTTAPAVSSTSTTVLSTHAPASVTVLVANGTSTSGLAGKLKTKLSTAGYDLLAPTDTTSAANASAVYYASGYQGDAQAVAAAAGIASGSTQPLTSSVPVAKTLGADVVVVIGPDLVSSLS